MEQIQRICEFKCASAIMQIPIDSNQQTSKMILFSSAGSLGMKVLHQKNIYEVDQKQKPVEMQFNAWTTTLTYALESTEVSCEL